MQAPTRKGFGRALGQQVAVLPGARRESGYITVCKRGGDNRLCVKWVVAHEDGVRVAKTEWGTYDGRKAAVPSSDWTGERERCPICSDWLSGVLPHFPKIFLGKLLYAWWSISERARLRGEWSVMEK